MQKRLLAAYGLLLLAALGSYALLGWHVRMLADDYCMAAIGMSFGPIGTVQHFNETWNGLYSLSFITGLVAWTMPGLMQVQTLLLLGAFLLSLWVLSGMLAQSLHFKLDRLTRAVIVLVVTLLIVYSVPSFRTLYWYSVLFQNALQAAWLILGLCAAWALLRPSIGRWQRWLGVVGLAALTFVVVGSANTFFLPLMGALVLAAIYAVWRVPLEQRRAALGMIAAVGVTAMVAFALVFTAPGNAVRQAQVFELTGFSPPSIDSLILISLQLLASYITFPASLLYFALPLAVGVVMTMALGSQDAARIAGFPLSKRWAWVDALALVVLALGVALATVVTTAYGVGSVVWHTMFFPRVIQALCMVALGYMLVVWLARRGFPSDEIKRRPAYRAVRLTLIGLMIALPLGALVNNFSRLPNFQEYAQDWDAVHAMIRAEVAAGNRGVIEVPPYRYSLAAALFLDEIDQPDGFTRPCAAAFYGVEDIVMPPIQNPPRVGVWRPDSP
jgi:hypothetical protein